MNKSNTLIIGVIFIFIGVFMLLDKFAVLRFSWYEIYPLAMLLFAALLWTKSMSGKHDSVFWASFFSVLGIFFFLRNYDMVDYLWFADVWPVLLVALGAGFISLFAFRSSEWGLLIPGSFLTLVGILFFLDDMNITYEYTHYLASNFWALLLVLLGGGLIVSALRRRQKEEKETKP